MSISNNSSVIFDSLADWIKELGLHQYLTNQELESGRLVGQLMRKIVEGYNLQLMNSNSAVNRVSNWNNLITQLKTINIRVSQDEKTKIINGNKDIVYQIIHKLKQYYYRNQKQNEVDISRIDPQATINQSSSLLQLLILSIMKHFGLSSKQSVALLSNESRYLAHILAKGFKGEFKPIINLLSELYDHSELLYQFCSKNKDNQQFFLRATKPALISKSSQVSKLGLELLERYLQRTHSDPSHANHKIQILKQYLLSTLLLGIKRHPSLISEILKFYIKFAEGSSEMLVMLTSDLFPVNPNNQKQNECYHILVGFFQEMKAQNKTNAFFELRNLGQTIGRSISSIRNSNTAISALNFIIEIIRERPEFLQEVKESRNIVGNIEQISSAFPKQGMEAVFIVQLFALLSILGGAKIYLAPGIYKVLVNKYSDTINRNLLDIFAQNFSQIIRQFPSIPYSLIITTLNSKLENNKLDIITQKQLEMFQIVVEAQAENMESGDEKNLLIIYNIVSKFFLDEPAFHQSSQQIIIEIIRKFGNVYQIFYDLTNKFIKVCLAVYFANAKKLYMSAMKHRKSPTYIPSASDPEDLYMKLKNFFIQALLYKLMEQKNQKISGSAQPLICYSLIQIENMNKQSGTGLRRIVSLFGKPEEVLEKYEVEAHKLDIENSKKEEGMKKSKLKQGSWGGNSSNRYSKSPHNQSKIGSHQAHNSEQGLSAKKFSTGKYSSFQSQLGVTPAAQRGLEKYQKVYLSKIQKNQKEQAKKKEEEQRQSYLKKIFQRKMLDKGIEVKKFNEQDYQYIYADGEKEREINLDKAKGKLLLPYYEAENQEERDIKGLEYTLRKYSKILKLYYSNYSGHHRPKNLESFDQIAEKYNLLYSASVIKMIKEHNLDELITVREIQALCKKINLYLNKKMDDPTSLDYEGFEQFIVQASYTMFTRPPNDMRGHPISEMIEETMSRFRIYASENRLSQKLFDDPENAYLNQTQAVRELNRKLAENSEYILPEGYKKIVEKKVFYTHRIFLDAMSPQYKDVYEVMDEIIEKAFNVHIIEPFTTYETSAKARPALYSHQRPDVDVYSEKMSVFMKKQVLKIPIKDRQTAKQSALVLEDIVEAVELGHDKIGLKHENTIIKSKKREMEQQMKRQEDEKKKWESYTRQIKSALVKHKQFKQQKQVEVKEKRKEEKRKEEQKQRKRKQEEERLKKRVEEYQQKKREDLERRKKEDRERRKKEKIDAQKKKKEAEETKKKIQEIKQQKEEEEAARRKLEQAEKKKQRLQQKRKFQEQQRRKKEMVEEYKNSKGLNASKLENQSKLEESRND